MANGMQRGPEGRAAKPMPPRCSATDVAAQPTRSWTSMRGMRACECRLSPIERWSVSWSGAADSCGMPWRRVGNGRRSRRSQARRRGVRKTWRRAGLGAEPIVRGSDVRRRLAMRNQVCLDAQTRYSFMHRRVMLQTPSVHSNNDWLLHGLRRPSRGVASNNCQTLYPQNANENLMALRVASSRRTPALSSGQV